ncbi:MAG: PrsW family glutamic-type intramembrane protease [Actinomycetota bacterium]|nr:PrsW family glutamic-type intramembrane protease [Actinomycetota bacterium]
MTDPGHGGARTLILALLTAVIYLVTIRAMDVNEKEPLWAVALLFVLGLTTGAALPFVVESRILEATTFPAAFVKEFAKLLALSIAFASLVAVGRQRGWLEVSGIVDGIIYGATLGLGFATGISTVLVSAVPTSPALASQGMLSVLLPIAVSGLSQGLFGALIGAGFGAAVESGSPAGRLLFPLVGFLAAVAAHAAYLSLIRGNALGGTVALFRTWVGLAMPLLFVLSVFLFALRREKRAIAEELAGEEGLGAEPLSFTARRRRRLAALAKGNVRAYLARRKLHNRQVMLALAKRRAKRQKDSERRSRMEDEIKRLRSTVLRLNEQL